MDELPREARDLLQAAAAADNPTHTERKQVDAAVRASLSAYGVHLSPLAPSSSATADATISGAKPAGTIGAATVKVGVGVLIICIGAWLGLRVYEDGSQPRVPTAVVARATPAAAAPRMQPPEPAVEPAQASELQPAAVTAAPQSRSGNRSRVALPRRTAQAPSLDPEMQLIAEADRLVRAEHFTAALRTLTLHAQRFPHGALREERAALRVLSLCGVGRSPRALRERERFLQQAPHSVLSARVGAACLEP